MKKVQNLLITMENKDWSYNLILGIVFTLVFFWLLSESEPVTYRGLRIDIRIVRMLSLLIAVINFASYLGLKKRN